MIKYRILEKIYDDGNKEYIVQCNILFGLPLFWFTVSYSSLNPPHPDLTVPALCTLNAVYSSFEEAKKCLDGLTNNKHPKVIKTKVIK